MAEIIYLDDHRAGVHVYCPELGQRKPEVPMEATLGRGITERSPSWYPGSRKQLEGWRSYQVTRRAFEKLKEQYPIAMESLLD